MTPDYERGFRIGVSHYRLSWRSIVCWTDPNQSFQSGYRNGQVWASGVNLPHDTLVPPSYRNREPRVFVL